MFALADCNNFYASCERLFAPRLEGQPVVVLSNNDGCIIARSNEAKALGIPMGAPYFKVKELLQTHRVAVFSSNYPLYGDISRRVMQVLIPFAPLSEIYSIDECFLDFEELPFDRTDYALKIAKTVRQWTGIPISIGIGPTKTLAKIANRLAKKGHSPAGPVLDWSCLPSPESVLEHTPVEDIWGIASRWGARLRQIGIENALALRNAEVCVVRGNFGVVMERIVLELRGVSCIPLEIAPLPRKQIMVSRSFGRQLTALDDLHSAVESFTSCAAEKLRAQHLCAQAVCVFLQTNRLDISRPAYANSLTLPLESPSQDTALLIRRSLQALSRIHRPNYTYHKAGVLMLDLVPSDQQQSALFGPSSDERERCGRRMEAIDRINRTFGRQTIHFGSEALSDHWKMRAQLKSPAYTTRWDELPRVKAN